MNRYRKGGDLCVAELMQNFSHHKSNNTFNNTLPYHHENKYIFI